MGNLQDGEVDYSDLSFTSDDSDIEKYLLKPNELLFNRTNSSERVGKTSVYRGDVPAIFAGYIIRVKPIAINTFYLNYLMNSEHHRNICHQAKTDGVNQSNINAQKLSRFVYPIPPLAEQHRIVVAIESAFAVIDEIERNKADLQTVVAVAKSKILSLAIHGKLVPQDLSDEPASVLLDRIRAERGALIKAGKIKRGKGDSVVVRGDDNSYYAGLPFDIPKSWTWVRLGEICNYGSCDSVSADNISDDAWILDLEDIEKDSAKVLRVIRKHERYFTSTKHSFAKGQVLYSKLRPYLNKVLVASEDGYCTSEILPLSFKIEVCSEYVRAFLMSDYFLSYANQRSYGVKMPRLGTNDGKKALFALPPLGEQ
jgi:type I restriction enzyme S subunit